MSDITSAETGFLQRLTWLHTWSGLILGWVLFALWIAGTMSVFWMEISYWARPELHATRNLQPQELAQYGLNYLQREAPDSRSWSIYMDDYARNPLLVLNWLDENNENRFVSLVPDGSGRRVTTETQGGRFFVDFHWTFNRTFPDQSGRHFQWTFMLSGAAGLVFLIGCLSGVFIHRKIFQNFFTFRPKAKGAQTRWLDAHNVLGVLPWPFHVMIIVTGLVFYGYFYIPTGVRTASAMQEPAAAASQAPRRATGGIPPSPVFFGGRYDMDLVGRAPRNLPPAPGARAANVPLAELYGQAESRIGPVAFISVNNPNRNNATYRFTGGRTTAVTFTTESVTFDGVTGRIIQSGSGNVSAMRSFLNANAGLHFAFFGGQPMRLLYFLCGAAGTIMIACGLMLFTAKRRSKFNSKAAGNFYDIVDRLNVAAIAGATFACITYLWAVRLLPYDLPETGGGFFGGVYSTIRAMPFGAATRPDWELYSFWLAWGLATVHALVRAPKQAWIEQLSIIAALCIGLPMVGYLVPNSGLFDMIAAGDWKTAAVDLSAFTIGVGFAWAAWKVSGNRFVKSLAPAASKVAAE